MIKFFHHIRRSLLSNNNTGKYLVYAIGEIILVVLGILIALQINNWNERNKLRKTEIKILKELEIALKDDSRNLRINVQSYIIVKRSLEIINEQLDLKNPTNDSLSFAFQNSLFNNTVAPNIGAYETLKAKGLDLISNDSIREKIILVYEISYKYYQDVAKNRYLSESFIQEYCATLFNNLDSFDPTAMVPNNYSLLRKDTLYRTIINTRIAQVKLSLLDLEFNKKSVDDLRSGIRAEVKNLEG